MSESTKESPQAAETSDQTSSATDGPKTVSWAEIKAAGGIRPWVDAELRRQDLLAEGVDTSTLSAAEKKRFKARREQERKVRRQLTRQGWQIFRANHLVHIGADIFYHDTVDIDRFDIEEPELRRKDNQLPELADVAALADVLGFSVSRLRWLIFHRDVDSGTHYHRWQVPKRSGGMRLISAPKPQLKAAQSWIARNITEHLPVHGAAHGFLPGRSTLTNARVHAGAKVLVKFDIKDFYPTVTQPRVKGMLRKAGYNEQVATVLSMLCTESPREEMELHGKKHFVALGPRSLPQGAPTSPSLSNAVAMRIDARLSGFCQKRGFRYTRYADDMTFSWHEGSSDAPVGLLMRVVEEVVRDEGFALNRKKTRVMRRGGCQRVTGLVVNRNGSEPRDVRVPREMIRKLRAAIYNREQGRGEKGETGTQEAGQARESLAQLRGVAAYIYMADPEKGQAFFDRLDALSAKQTAQSPKDSEDSRE
jgi:RNA-directed DNA polymerase